MRQQAFAQSGQLPASASCHSPTDPALRANPFPEVTDRICRLPLPTLFCRPEAVHLGDLLRIWVRPRTKITPSPSDFHGPTRVHRTPQETRCFTMPPTLSPGEPIPGFAHLTKKRELFPGPTPASPSSIALPHSVPKHQSPCRGLRILTQFPFSSHTGDDEQRPQSKTAFAYTLGPADPCSTAVHMEPFSTSTFKVLI